VEYLKQIMPPRVVPPLEDLEQVLFQGLIAKHPHKMPLLPMRDDDYDDFLARYPMCDDLPNWIGPMSKITSARGLARVITAVLDDEPTAPESELGLSGVCAHMHPNS
jgi:hypothetical protein